MKNPLICACPVLLAIAGCNGVEISGSGHAQGDVGPNMSPAVIAAGLIATCGDGILDEGEQCDDGNTSDGDYCNATCTAGLDVTGTNCSETALQSMIDTAVGAAETQGRTDLATIVELPPNAQLRMCESGCTIGDELASPYNQPRACIVFPRRVLLRGNESRLEVPYNRIGIQIDTLATGSVVEELSIRFPGLADPSSAPEDPWRPYPHEGIGIKVKSGLARLRDLRIFYAGVGMSFIGGSGLNVSAMSVRDSWIYGCSKYGVEVGGGDAQGGSFSGLLVQACRNSAGTAVAIFENGFLGNNHAGHLLEANDVAIRTVNTANASTWTGIYVESSDGVDIGSNNTTVVGAQLSARAEVTRGTRVGGRTSHVVYGGYDSAGHSNFVEIPAINGTNGQFTGNMYWGRYAAGIRSCISTGDCADRLDVCTGGLCTRPGPGHDYWLWRRSPQDAVGVYEWEIWNQSSATAFRARVSDVNGDGNIREGTLSPGGNPYCGYLANVCEP